MTEKQASYRQIFKATSIFGGVQIFNIFIALIRGKLLAVLIGSNGMGFNGLLMSNLNLIKTISGLGLEQSAVRDLSVAYSLGDTHSISKAYFVFKRWIWISAILGALITISFSPLLSKLAFGDGRHTISYIFLSATFIFMALTGGIYTLLRASRKIETLAKANVAGSVAGLVVVIPVFYFLGIKGVIPAIILSSIVNYLVSIYFKKSIQLDYTNISWKETLSEGKGMVLLGITLSISALFTTSTEYALSIFITKNGSLSDLGLYNAGMSIIGGYVGMIFTAIGTDFFPRLSGSINNESKWKEIVYQQSELMLLMLGPLLILILASAPLLVRILLSAEFLPVVDFIILAVLAIIFKAFVWVQGFILVAKGQNRLFLITEVIGSCFFLFVNIVFFGHFGLKGLGFAMIVSYIFSWVMLSLVLKRKYNYTFHRALILYSGIFILLIMLAIAFVYLLGFPNAYYSGLILFIISGIISYYELDKRIGIKTLVNEIKKKILN